MLSEPLNRASSDDSPIPITCRPVLALGAEATLSSRSFSLSNQPEQSEVVLTDRHRPSAGRQRFGHSPFFVVVVAQQVPQLVHRDRQQVHSVLLALIARYRELAVLVRRWIDKPTPAGGVHVERDGVARRQAERGVLQVGNADIRLPPINIRPRRFPASERASVSSGCTCARVRDSASTGAVAAQPAAMSGLGCDPKNRISSGRRLAVVGPQLSVPATMMLPSDCRATASPTKE